MSDAGPGSSGACTVRQVGEIETPGRGGFHEAGGKLRLVRHALGVTAFGIQVLEFPPDMTAYPEHDHGDSGQEEVYLVLSGSGRLHVNREVHDLGPDAVVRVAAGATRKWFAGPNGLRLVAVGGTPGAAYEIPDAFRGAARPAAQS